MGANENGLRHCGQKPSVRPGEPSRERPTGVPQLGQNRRSSGTCGSTSSAFSGSIRGTGGTVVRPAPSRAPRNRLVPARFRVTLVPPVRAEPIGALASRFEEVTRLEPSGLAPNPEDPDDPEPDDDLPDDERPGDAEPEATEPDDGATGAPAGLPQTSQ